MTRAVQNPGIPAPTLAGPFAFSLSLPVPEKAAKVTSSRPPLPYGEYLDAFEPYAKADQKPHFFVPCSFYKDRPGVNFEKVDPAYVRTKVREFFNKWAKEEGKGRESLYLTMVNRDGKDEGSLAMAEALKIEAEPGVSVWVLKAQAA